MVKYIFYPLTITQGVYSISENNISDMFRQMVADDTLKYTFPDGSIQEYHQFFEFVLTHAYSFWAILDNEKQGALVGFVYLDKIADNRAYLHFCIFSDYWGRHNTIEIAKFVEDKLFSYRDEENNFLLRYLYGEIMEDNKYAQGFIGAMGVKKVGYLPEYFYNPYLKKYCNVILYAKKNINIKEDYHGK